MGLIVNLLRLSHLLDPRVVHDHDLVGQLKGLFLVVGHEESGERNLFVKGA